jgi:hypothetical protein
VHELNIRKIQTANAQSVASLASISADTWFTKTIQHQKMYGIMRQVVAAY